MFDRGQFYEIFVLFDGFQRTKISAHIDWKRDLSLNKIWKRFKLNRTFQSKKKNNNNLNIHFLSEKIHQS